MARDIEKEIEALLAAREHLDNPLRAPLAAMLKLHRDQQRKFNRAARIADLYQSSMRDTNVSLSDRFGKQVRQIERIMRVSDRYQRIMRDLNQALEEASTQDLLTGLANRRHLLERIKAESARRTRRKVPFCIAMADVDHFKGVNDRYGHEAGDLVLVQVAANMRAGLREADLCGRWGGEEFLLLLPDTHLADAVMLIDRIRERIAAQSVVGDGKLVTVTASFGVVEQHVKESVADTIRRADEAMYIAKHKGRNRVAWVE